MTLLSMPKAPSYPLSLAKLADNGPIKWTRSRNGCINCRLRRKGCRLESDGSGCSTCKKRLMKCLGYCAEPLPREGKLAKSEELERCKQYMQQWGNGGRRGGLDGLPFVTEPDGSRWLDLSEFGQYSMFPPVGSTPLSPTPSTAMSIPSEPTSPSSSYLNFCHGGVSEQPLTSHQNSDGFHLAFPHPLNSPIAEQQSAPYTGNVSTESQPYSHLQGQYVGEAISSRDGWDVYDWTQQVSGDNLAASPSQCQGGLGLNFANGANNLTMNPDIAVGTSTPSFQNGPQYPHAPPPQHGPYDMSSTLEHGQSLTIFPDGAGQSSGVTYDVHNPHSSILNVNEHLPQPRYSTVQTRTLAGASVLQTLAPSTFPPQLEAPSSYSNSCTSDQQAHIEHDAVQPIHSATSFRLGFAPNTIYPPTSRYFGSAPPTALCDVNSPLCNLLSPPPQLNVSSNSPAMIEAEEPNPLQTFAPSNAPSSHNGLHASGVFRESSASALGPGEPIGRRASVTPGPYIDNDILMGNAAVMCIPHTVGSTLPGNPGLVTSENPNAAWKEQYRKPNGKLPSVLRDTCCDDGEGEGEGKAPYYWDVAGIHERAAQLSLPQIVVTDPSMSGDAVQPDNHSH